MKAQAFKMLLVNANTTASKESWNADRLTAIKGDCVVVIGLNEQCKKIAIQLGAESVDVGVLFAPAGKSVAGVLFAPAEASVPNVPAIKHESVWAHTFQRVLVEQGLRAYVMNRHFIEL